MEERRLRAADLFAEGVRQAEIARQVGVTHQTVSDWHAAWKQGGREALRGAGRAGRRSKLSPEQLAEVTAALSKGPTANGYPTELWTLARVAEVIERVTGVEYHPGHVWRILRAQLGWTRQRPARQAVERDDAAIERWVRERWPKAKKGPGAGAR
jgi:transposase